MQPIITFVIPVRHQANATDWSALCGRLSQAMASIAGQTDSRWHGVVVANEGADLPPMPAGFSVERVNFPPNTLYDISAADREAVYDSFRWDKGRRVLAGMLAHRDTAYFMIVDDDDLVSSNLVGFVAGHAGENGWKIRRGWVWSEDGSLVMKNDNFSGICGTSLIIRTDLYALPASLDQASEEFVKSMLGSHVRIEGILSAKGAPLCDLPFRGAVYRVGHAGAHSASQSLISSEVLNKALFRRPWRLLSNLSRLRRVGPAFRSEFFGQK